jgi:phosphodiesterase/alkaline phosphatase D-like protein
MQPLNLKQVESRNNSKITVLKTIRIPKYIANKLEEVAYEKNMKFNSIVSEELEKYVYYTYRIEKVSQDNIVTISYRFFRLIIESLGKSENEIVHMANSAGKDWGKEYIMLWSEICKNCDKIDIFVVLLKYIAKYSGLYSITILNMQEKENYTVLLHHTLNRIYSLILAYYYEGILEALNLKTNFEIKENSVIMNIYK